ncbi:MAG: restriction endonuclease subunit S [Candidatus Marinimicrobia bacterium]|nr:restriction endonuclease subunit S [Candidatus Neomarinimicrobiota bacterium]
MAEVLSDTDALIGALEKRIAKKRLIKQGAIQTLLTPKDDWEVKKLGEVASFFKGKGLPKSALVSEGKFKCIHYGELFTQYEERITEYFSYTDKTDNCFYSKKNDVLMPTSDVTPNGLATASCVLEDNVIIGGDILVIRIPENVINGIFLSYSIKKSREQVMKLVTGSTVYHIYGSDMANFVFKYPKIEEQNRIATILSDIDNEIDALEKKLAKTKKLKQGLMQQLLTGKIRLV